MYTGGPRNDQYLELLGTDTLVTLTAPNGQYRAYTMEMMVDVMLTEVITTNTLAVPIIGDDDGLGWFEADTPAVTADREMPVRFSSKRGATTKKSGDGTLVLGERTVLFGKDNGTNVYAWQDGVALGKLTAQADWTATQAADAILVLTTFGFGTGAKLRLYEFWLKLNGTVIIHWKPKAEMMDLATPRLVDASAFSNDGLLSGTAQGNEDVAYWIRSAWNTVEAP